MRRSDGGRRGASGLVAALAALLLAACAVEGSAPDRPGLPNPLQRPLAFCEGVLDDLTTRPASDVQGFAARLAPAADRETVAREMASVVAAIRRYAGDSARPVEELPIAVPAPYTAVVQRWATANMNDLYVACLVRPVGPSRFRLSVFAESQRPLLAPKIRAEIDGERGTLPAVPPPREERSS